MGWGHESGRAEVMGRYPRIKPGRGHPWMYAEEAGRDYLTPEDISQALVYASQSHVRKIVLMAIAEGKCEDVKLCAFVAAGMK